MKVVVMLTKVFFDQHPRAGEPTNFASLVKQGLKVHTCRDNYQYWADKVAKLKEAGGTLSVRQWSGKPYRSPQEIVVEIPASEVEVSELTMEHNFYPEPNRPHHECHYYRAMIDNKPIDMKKLAQNDGFSRVEDFTEFIQPLFTKYQKRVIRLAIIHFNSYRYE